MELPNVHAWSVITCSRWFNQFTPYGSGRGFHRFIFLVKRVAGAKIKKHNFSTFGGPPHPLLGIEKERKIE